MTNDKMTRLSLELGLVRFWESLYRDVGGFGKGRKAHARAVSEVLTGTALFYWFIMKDDKFIKDSTYKAFESISADLEKIIYNE